MTFLLLLQVVKIAPEEVPGMKGDTSGKKIFSISIPEGSCASAKN